MQTTDPILTIGHQFAGYCIKTKLSTRHDGVREVYRGVDAMGEEAVVTVYDLGSSRYASGEKGRKLQAEDIPEVRFSKEHEGMKYVAPFLGCGVSRHGRRRLAWMVQKFMPGKTLDEEIRCREIIDLSDATLIIHHIAEVVKAVAQFTNGGGHYNIYTDNIIVNYKGDELIDVRLVGFTNIGTSYSGNAPIDKVDLDKRFRAPETNKCIYSHKSDIYSLGMVLLLMLTGYPKVIKTEHYSIDLGCATVDMTDISSMDFYKALWKLGDKNLSNALHLVLRKATDISPTGRFATVDKFNEFLQKVEKKQIMQKTVHSRSPKTVISVHFRRVCGDGRCLWLQN